MSPNLVWIIGRSRTDNNTIWDTTRTAGRALYTNLGNADEDQGTGLTAFGSDGFSLGALNDVNYSSATYVAFSWKESADAGMDIVSMTGTGSARTQAHSLSAVPEWIFVKELDNAGSWYTYTAILGNTKAMFLNATNAVSADSSGYWNDTTPTSSVFSLGTDGGVNQSSTDYIAYLWRSIQGFSKVGQSYYGNGATSNYIHTGFKVGFLMVKRTDSTEGWFLIDATRNTSNPVKNFLRPNGTNAEDTGTVWCDFTANGFNWKASDGLQNASGATYIYMAFAEAPFVNSNGVPCNAR